MCSSASTAVCTMMTLLPPGRPLPDAAILTEVMRTAAKMNAASQPRGEQPRLLSVHEVIARTRLAQWLVTQDSRLLFEEVGGLVTGTPADMRTDHCMDLCELLQRLPEHSSCALTCDGHTVSTGRRGPVQWWLCDSLPGEFICVEGLCMLLPRLQRALPSAREYSAVVFRVAEPPPT